MPDHVASAAVFGANVERAVRYAELLSTEAITRGLIGPREADRVWERHLFNSAAVAPLVPEASSVVDLGSGAGLPGIPLALARPDLQVLLLEPMVRRTTFLEECVADLALTNVSVRRGRAQDGISPLTDNVVARAVASLGALAELALGLCKPGGVLFALKGEKADAEATEMAAAGGFTAVVHRLTDAVGAPAIVAEVRRTARQGRKAP